MVPGFPVPEPSIPTFSTKEFKKLPATRQTNTFDEGLSKLLTQIAQLQTAPDADIDFLANLQVIVVQKLREPVEASVGAPPMEPIPVSPAPVGGGIPGVRDGINIPPSLPPVDELRRMTNQ